MRDDLLVRVVDLRGPGREKSADPAMGADPGELSLLLDPGQDWDLTTKDGVREPPGQLRDGIDYRPRGGLKGIEVPG